MFQASRNDAARQLPGGIPTGHAPAEKSEVELIELAREGDGEAFTRLFQSYNAQICTYLGRLVGNAELGRDLTQETFLHAWKSLPALRSDLSFKSWLYRVATNLAKSHLRRERLIRWLPWVEYEQEGEFEQLSIAGPEERTNASECIQLTLAQLSPQSRVCLLLQLVAGFSQREIGTLLGISEKSVSSYVSRGKEQFRMAYQRLEEG